MAKYLLVIVLVFSGLFTSAQIGGGLVGGGMGNPNLKIHRQAQKLWKAENYSEAEKLFRKATTANYPLPLQDLARNKFELGDIKGANLAFDEVIELLAGNTAYYNLRVQLMLTYSEKIDNNFKSGNQKEGLATTLKFVDALGKKVSSMERSYFNKAYLNACETAFALDDEQALSKLYEAAARIDKGDLGEFVSFVYLRLVRKEYTEALQRIEDVIKNGGGFVMSRNLAGRLLPEVYAYMGENEKALEAIKKSTSSVWVGDGYFQYVHGIIALNKKDYNSAVSYFNEAIKGYMVLYVRLEPVGKYKHYTKRAEAYLGLGDLIQARKDFEAALVYNPSYEPALNGIAMLEGRMIADRKSDKTPPSIVITEPAVTRGLKVTSAGADIMVRGKATDASGLKSVALNGKVVYSKSEGDFWGSVTLANGSNKITVEATDAAGNIAREVIEIEKKATAVASNDIVPVERKEGKNYAVLIASQNYDDSAIPSLENPIPDAVKLKMILKNSYNFSQENILTLFNPERSDFRKKFLQLTEILQPEDNLIIFYAGHGIWVEKEKKGYWLLTDAKRNDVNTWLPNKEVLDMIAEVPSRHTLLITDACFSGSVFRTRSIGADAPAAVREMSEKISRVAITSGNDTEVPDESVFMKYLVKALSDNKEKYLTAQKMFITQIIEAVMEESKTEPRYGTLESAGHVGGDYIFTKN